jgi:DNA-binding MarR family transcriptional regulator
MRETAVLSTEIDPLRAASTFVRVVRVLDQRLKATSPDELGLAEVGVLAEIGRGTTLPSAIARATRLDPARVSRLAERLVRLGLVERRISAHDRRQVPLALTPRGEQRVARAREEAREAMGTLLASLSEREREALAVAVDGLQRLLTQTA